MKPTNLFPSILIIMVAITNCNSPGPGAIKTEVKFENGTYSLYRGGEPYYINGAGCEFGDIPSLAEHGANSFRTWRTENGRQTAQEILDTAQAYGLSVLMGLDVGRERHGFDYNDSAWVKKQFEYIKGEVMKYKDHPALLGWGIGNELNLDYTNEKVWDAVNEIAKMIREIDGNHVTTTMLAGIGKKEVDFINEKCPELDFLSIQMYGDIINLQKRIDDAGWNGPYVVTEWGATGHWEVPKTEWGIPIEQTSSEKADAIMERWNKAISSNQTHCLGSYVFLWGQKQERTPTWYGLFLESGEETEAIDVMEYNWTGKWPENRVPRLDSLFLDGKKRYDNVKLNKNEQYNLDIFAHDPDGDKLTMKIEILPDVSDYFGHGGDFEKRPQSVYVKDNIPYTNNINIVSPENEGPYRVFVYIFDGHNNAAYANIPFFLYE